MTLALQPCPNPECRGDVRLRRPIGSRHWSVICRRCGLTGPKADAEGEAARLWGLLPAPPPPVLRAVCAGCGVVLRAGDAAEPVSHGICPACLRNMYGEEMAAEVAGELARAPADGSEP
jgi:hypothetical protein